MIKPKKETKTTEEATVLNEEKEIKKEEVKKENTERPLYCSNCGKEIK